MKVSRFIQFVLSLLCLYSSAAARTWHVKAGGTGDAPTIQAAIDLASDGDTVILAIGTYTGEGNRDIDYRGKAITVRSQNNNPRGCIVDCQGSEADPHRGFYFHSGEDSNSVLQGVTIRNGYAPTSALPAFPPELGRITQHLGRIFPRGSATNRVSVGRSSCILCLAMDARKVLYAEYMKDATGSVFEFMRHREPGFGMRENQPLASLRGLMSSLEEPTISEQLYSYGGGILCADDEDNSVSPTFVNCSFNDNSADIGGGLYAHSRHESTTFKIKDCRFFDNSGGGLTAAYDMTVRLEGCTFARNLPGGLSVVYSGVDATGCTFLENGKGAGLKYSLNKFVGCDFSDNGTGLGLSEAGATLVNCAFSGNEEGLYCEDAHVELDNCNFSDNETGLQGENALVQARNSVFLRNRGDNAWSGGCAVWAGVHRTCVLTGCTFVENSGSSGGGLSVMVESFLGPGMTLIENCTFVGNSATRGGAIFHGGAGEQRTQVFNCTFSRNSAARGGAMYCYGYQETDETFEATVANCTLADNSGDQGGGIFCEGLLSLDLKSTIIAGSSNGEALFCNEVEPDPTLSCCDIFGNASGDWVGCLQNQFGVNGNISSDPLFCDPEDGNFALASLSDCLPANNLCNELIGAHGEGCSTPTGIASDTHLKADDVALRNSPNPFNPQTRITYLLPTQGFAKLSVYDVAGRLVEKLVDAVQPAGEHAVEWRADTLPSGIYLCRLEAGGVVESRKLVLLK